MSCASKFFWKEFYENRGRENETNVELSRPEICHLVGEICADKSLKLLKKQLNGNFYSFTGH
jgi:hypothetical protein